MVGNTLGIYGIALGIGAIVLCLIANKKAPPERKEFVKKMVLPGIILGILAIIFGCLSLLI